MPMKTYFDNFHDFQDRCAFIYGDVMERVKSLPEEWRFESCRYDVMYNSYYVLFRTKTESLCITVTFDREMNCKLSEHRHQTDSTISGK